jgi:hypothetical protein
MDRIDRIKTGFYLCLSAQICDFIFLSLCLCVEKII